MIQIRHDFPRFFFEWGGKLRADNKLVLKRNLHLDNCILSLDKMQKWIYFWEDGGGVGGNLPFASFTCMNTIWIFFGWVLLCIYLKRSLGLPISSNKTKGWRPCRLLSTRLKMTSHQKNTKRCSTWAKQDRNHKQGQPFWFLPFWKFKILRICGKIRIYEIMKVNPKSYS